MTPIKIGYPIKKSNQIDFFILGMPGMAYI